MGNKIKSFFAVVLCFVIPVMFCSCKKEHTEHTFSQEWVSDENSHWHPCTFEGCTEKSDSAEHTWDNGTVSGHKTIYKCTVCERTKETVNEHIANTTEWEKDDTQHWHACTIDGCTEKVNASSHDWNEGIVVGHYTNYECLTCGQTKQVKNPCKAKINGAWSKDDDYHWHDCSVGSCDEKVDKALHNWGEGEPSGHYINYTCRDCGLIKSDKIPCDYDLSKWEYDETHHWHPCTIDGCELTSEKVEHNFDYTKGEVEGHYTVYTCSDCNATKYVKNDCIPASEWQKNDNYHWHYCTILGCSEELDKSEHTWNNGVLTEYGLLITCTMCGTERLECGDCSYDTENWEKNEDFHWHACKNVGCTSSQDKAKHDYLEGTRVVINGDGSHLLIKTCGTCGYEHSELLEHSFEGAEWESDETHHWLECIVEGCTIIDEKIEHRFDKTLVGHNYVYTCVCGKTKTEKAECQFVDTEWESDEIHHWHECTIEGCTEDTKIKDKGTHTWNDGEILGHSITYTCTICGLNKTEDAEHNYTNAEWQSDETYHWHECTIDGCTEIDEQIEHTFGKPVIVDHRNVYTCECGYKKYETIKHNYEWDKGNETNHWQYCTIEGCTVTQNHATHTWEKISTSNAESGTGHIEIYKCTVCQREKQKNISCDVDTTAWKLDETHHWHACTIDGCTIKDSKEEHDFEKVTKGDEVTYTCKKCNFIKKEYLNIYIRGIEALASNPYKITLKNFELKTDTYQNIDFSELYLGLDDDNKIIGYGYCNITEPDTNNTLINVIAYIEDETIYFSYTNETDYNISIYTISQFFNELDILVSGKIEGGLTSIMQILSQANTTFSEEIDTIIKYFVGIYNRAELNSKLEKFVEYFYTKSKVEDTFVYTFNYNSLRKLNKFFDTKSVADVIDMINGEGSFDLLIDYLKSAVDLTVSQWLEVGKDNGLDIDAVLDYLDVLAQKYYEMVTGDSEIMEDEEQLEEPSEEQKITFEMLIGSITGMEIPDIGEYIKSEDVKDKTVVDAINLIIDMINQKSETTGSSDTIEHITAGQLKGAIEVVATDYLEDKTIYELANEIIAYIYQMIQQNKDNGSQFAISSTEYQGSDTYNYIDALISMIEEMGTITLTTSVDGTIESYKIVVKSDMVSATLEILKDDKPVKTEEYKAFVKECKNLKTKLNSIKITEDSLPDVSETDYTKKRVVDSELGTVTVTYTCSYGSKLENESKSVNYSEIVYTFIFDKDGNFVKYIYNSESLSSGSNYSNSTYISSEFTYAPNMAMNVTYKCDDWVTITLFSESERYESVYYYSDDSSSGEVIEIFSASLFLELDLVNNKINIIEIFGNSRDCTYAEVVADRVRTDYGYLRHYVCSKCGNDYYTQLSNYLDDYVLESIVTCYNSLTNINTKYKLDELYVYNLEGFMYEYDSEIGNFVLTDDVDVKDTNDLGSYTSGYTFRYLPKQDVSE